MIDIHSHILWGLDDGARSLSESISLCSIADSAGTEILLATPHLMYWEEAEELLDRRNEQLYELGGILEEYDTQIEISPGFEILCDDDIFNIKYFKPYTLADSRYILIEFDFNRTSEEDVTAWCSYLGSFGLVPIIAHPERYGFVLSDISSIERLSRKGVLFQINAGSPAGMFGEEESIAALRMLNGGYVDFVGSDAHRIHVRNTDMAYCFEAYPSSANMSLLRKAVEENPEFILNDEKYIPNRKNIS